jgi:hypothetical protein
VILILLFFIGAKVNTDVFGSASPAALKLSHTTYGVTDQDQEL